MPHKVKSIEIFGERRDTILISEIPLLMDRIESILNITYYPIKNNENRVGII